MSFITQLATLSPAFLLPLSFVVALFGGEAGTMTMAFIASHTSYALPFVTAISFVGMLMTDSFWFLTTRSKLFARFRSHRKIAAHYEIIEEKITTFARGNDILILLFAKILVGTRILIILYLGGRNISYGRFMLYNTGPTALWAIALAFLGWLAARGYQNVFETFESITASITFLVFFAVLFYIGLVSFRKWLLQKKNTESVQ